MADSDAATPRRPKGRPPTNEASQQANKKGTKRKRLFTRELAAMMYGFGDVQNPQPESIDLLEEMVMDYVTEMVNAGGLQERRKASDRRFGVSRQKDRKKHERVLELLRMHEELKKARKAFEDTNIVKDVSEEKD